MKKAQISLEYLVILGLTVTIILGAVYLFVDHVRDTSSEAISSRINTLGIGIVQQAESIYAIGNGSWIDMDVQFPDQIINAYTAGSGEVSELVFVVQGPGGVSESVFFADINLTGGGTSLGAGKISLGRVDPGKSTIRIESRGDYVLLNSS